jgi:branched-chain amino acid transport system ATP-binding protein
VAGVSGTATALRVTGLAAGYGRGDVVKDITFAVPRGGSLLLVGHNGAGKTTIFRAIMGLCAVSAGSVEVTGASLDRRSPAERARDGLSYVMQEHGTFRGMTVQENLEVIIGLSGKLSRAQRSEAFTRVYDWFPRIHERRDSPARALSGGENRMLAISLGLIRKPAVMLLDEPTLGLAPATAESMVEVVRRIQEETGVALVITESSLTAVRALATETKVVRRGGLSHTIDDRTDITSLDEIL